MASTPLKRGRPKSSVVAVPAEPEPGTSSLGPGIAGKAQAWARLSCPSVVRSGMVPTPGRAKTTALIALSLLGLSVAVPPAVAGTPNASDPNVLKITGSTKPGSTATVVLDLGSPKGLTLAYGWFKHDCAGTYLEANAAHAKDYLNGGLSNIDGALKAGYHTFAAKYSSADPNWYVCAYLYVDKTASTMDWAKFHWK